MLKAGHSQSMLHLSYFALETNVVAPQSLTLPFRLGFRLCGLGELLQDIIEDDSLMLRTFPLL